MEKPSDISVSQWKSEYLNTEYVANKDTLTTPSEIRTFMNDKAAEFNTNEIIPHYSVEAEAKLALCFPDEEGQGWQAFQDNFYLVTKWTEPGFVQFYELCNEPVGEIRAIYDDCNTG